MSGSLETADFWLEWWGKQVRARRHGTLYLGNIDAGSFKPEDDPHPNAFIICQVDTCLSELGETHTAFALHWYSRRLRIEDFPGGEYRAKKLRRQIIVALGGQIASLDRTYMTIPDTVARERRLRSRRMRNRPQEQPNGNKD